MFRPAIIFLVIISLLVLTTSIAVGVGLQTGELQKKIVSPVQNSLSESLTGLAKAFAPKARVTSPSSLTVVSTSSSEVNVTVTETNTSKTPTTSPVAPVVQTKPCNRYVVVHLDGSSSNLCYSEADYNKLVNLGYSLSSAKTFYQFHLDGAQRYQDEKDRTGSDFWLNAKASQEQQAKREQEKIGQITLEMQTIEQRGY